MKKNLLLVVAALAIGSLATVACGGSSSAEDDSASGDDAITASKSIVGNWSDLDDADAAKIPFYDISFKSDGTYSAQGGCRPVGTGPHCFAISQSTGKWKLKKSGPQLGAPGGAPELELVDSFDQTSDYFYTLKSGKLSLNPNLIGSPSVFSKITPAIDPIPPSSPSVTGSWSETGANDADVLFYTYTFNSDGTYTARGGCRPGGSGAASCGAISVSSGKYTVGKSGPELGAPAGADQLETVDSFDQKSDFFYSVTDGKLTLSTSLVGDKKTVFEKE